MKKVNIPQSVRVNTDWNTPQWVVGNTMDGLTPFVILTSGEHSPTNFHGTALPCQDYPDGHISEGWDKDSFKPLVGGISFIISNED